MANPLVRIDRLLASRGYCSRSQVRAFLGAHDVRTADQRISRDDQKVPAGGIVIDNEPADPERIVVLLHKPLDTICSHDDGEGRLVYDLLPERWRRRNPTVTTVGRLDRDTSGLLLITDDGALVHRLTSPKRHVPKTYRVTLAQPLKGDEAARFASGGMTLANDPKPLLPATLEIIGERIVRLTIAEGRYHQVRRMFAAVGNHVVALHRERLGDLDLGDLPVGAWRWLDEADLARATRTPDAGRAALAT